MRPWTSASVTDAFGSAEAQLFNQAVNSPTGLIDYEDLIYGEQGLVTDSKISASGGNEKTKFFIGTSYRDEDGIIKNTGFDRFSIRANIDYEISDTFDLSLSSNFTQSESRRSFTGNENEGGLSYGYTLAFTRPWINLNPDSTGTRLVMQAWSRWGRTGAIDNIERLLEQMQQQNIAANPRIYSTVLSAYSKANVPDAIEQWIYWCW